MGIHAWFSARKRAVVAAFAVLVAFVAIAGTVSTAYAKDFGNFTWLQATSNSRTLDLGEMSPGGTLHFFAVATSPEDGEFQVVLEKQGFLWTWSQVGPTYTMSQTSKMHSDPRNGGKVSGQPFECVWSTSDKANYRVVLKNPTNPQATVFSRVEAW